MHMPIKAWLGASMRLQSDLPPVWVVSPEDKPPGCKWH